MSPDDGGTHLEWGVEVGGWGLSPKFSGWEFIVFIKTHFYGEHSLHISWRSILLLHIYFLFSWWRHQMETCSTSLAFVRGIDLWLQGFHRSPVKSPHTDQWLGALIPSLICAWTNGWVNNQDAGDLRRHRAHYDVMYCGPVIRAAVGSFGVQRVKLVGSVHYGRNGLRFGTLLYPDYYSLKLTIFCTQR